MGGNQSNICRRAKLVEITGWKMDDGMPLYKVAVRGEEGRVENVAQKQYTDFQELHVKILRDIEAEAVSLPSSLRKLGDKTLSLVRNLPSFPEPKNPKKKKYLGNPEKIANAQQKALSKHLHKCLPVFLTRRPDGDVKTNKRGSLQVSKSKKSLHEPNVRGISGGGGKLLFASVGTNLVEFLGRRIDGAIEGKTTSQNLDIVIPQASIRTESMFFQAISPLQRGHSLSMGEAVDLSQVGTEVRGESPISGIGDVGPPRVEKMGSTSTSSRAPTQPPSHKTHSMSSCRTNSKNKLPKSLLESIRKGSTEPPADYHRALASERNLALSLSPKNQERKMFQDRPLPKTMESKLRSILSDAKAEDLDRIHIRTYNVLCLSLGTNGIPWILTISEEMEKKMDAYLGKGETKGPQGPVTSWSAYKKEILTSEYLTHFHKNYRSGSYLDMRLFWCSSSVESDGDIPRKLTGLDYHAPNQVKYTGKKKQPIIATTLKGILQNSLDKKVAHELFVDILKREKTVFTWAKRGPKIFNKIIENPPSCKTSPDIIGLQEYDIHNAEATYTGGKLKTFRKAMTDEGYAGLMFQQPKGDAGIAVFWKRSVFAFEPWRSNTHSGTLVLQCGSRIAHSAYNFDMKEKWHCVKKGAKGDVSSLLNDGDRRNVGIVKLIHRRTHAITWVFCVHLMTSSRDKKGVTKFPGEVRAGEMEFIRRKAEKLVAPGEGIVFLGDFNTQPCHLDLLAGDVYSGEEKIHFSTGFNVDKKEFVWKSRHRSKRNIPTRVDVLPKVAQEVLGHSPSNRVSRDNSRSNLAPHDTKESDNRILKEAFETIHKWEKPKGRQCTSINADRAEWIDLMFYTPTTMTLEKPHIPIASGSKTLPDYENPSDHIPLTATFRLLHPNNCRICAVAKACLKDITMASK
ncbi:hypothetical protein AAMO2058_001087700 [Amorphochlora amoebiformis]|uniref:Endonuclease/exonuclease/phosphatase domain-containing protein n=1 Tax=Amorphochlora amoebiformis TaxID=1561963 RepID=A0A7S0DRJ6_9EUKA|mmetsp:Transcript_3756/g.5819  ORF Transcript_3756/g.5819 Transcript_3756/m.5819 type:complete len:909 (+) Transcript_3756:114-2840(+)